MRVKGQSRLDVSKYSFSQRTINEWNKLSADCVHASINMFKNIIDKCLIRVGSHDGLRLEKFSSILSNPEASLSTVI